MLRRLQKAVSYIAHKIYALLKRLASIAVAILLWLGPPDALSDIWQSYIGRYLPNHVEYVCPICSPITFTNPQGIG
jgi:hypothetical protein